MRKLIGSAVAAGLAAFGLVLASAAPVTAVAAPSAEPATGASASMEPATPAAIVTKPKPAAGVLNAACSYAATDIDSGAWSATGSGANIRSGSSTNCRIYDQAGTGDVLDYHCYTLGSDGFTWTYLRNDTDGTNGWVRDDLLSDFGSFVSCTTFV